MATILNHMLILYSGKFFYRFLCIFVHAYHDTRRLSHCSAAVRYPERVRATNSGSNSCLEAILLCIAYDSHPGDHAVSSTFLV